MYQRSGAAHAGWVSPAVSLTFDGLVLSVTDVEYIARTNPPRIS